MFDVVQPSKALQLTTDSSDRQATPHQPACQPFLGCNGYGHRLWAAVLERYYKELLSYLRRKVPDHAAAADLAQEAYVRIYASHPEQAQIEQPRHLLYKVAHNLVIDHYRQQKSRSGVIDEHASEDLQERSIGPASLEPEAVLSSKERLACLEAALAALAPRPREAFVLYKIDGLSRAQVAAQMGIGVRTVETHLEVAMAACSKALHHAENTAAPHRQEPNSSTLRQHQPQKR